MTEFFTEAHAWWQYVVLLTVVVALVFSFRGPEMTPFAEKVYRLTVVSVDIQVALGIVVWLAASGWSLGLMQGWIHPIAGLAALGVLHAFVGKARRTDLSQANRVMRTGLMIAVVLVVAAIVIAESS